MLKKIITIIFINFLFPSLETEEYIYDVEIQGLSMIAGNVGSCNLKIEKNEQNEYKMNIITKTTNLAKILYPYIDEIKLKIDNYFSLISESGLAFDDPSLSIDWKLPLNKLKISDKDLRQPKLNMLKKECSKFNYNKNLYE